MKEPKMYRVIAEAFYPYAEPDEMIRVIFESDNYEEAKEYFDTHRTTKDMLCIHHLQERDYCYRTIEKDR